MDVFAFMRPRFLFAVDRVFFKHARLIERAQPFGILTHRGQGLLPKCKAKDFQPLLAE